MGALCGKEEPSRNRQISFASCWGPLDEGTSKDFSTEGNANCVCFGAGCYWGTEKYFKLEFVKLYPESNIRGMVGFMGPAGAIERPTYQEVCVGDTGHIEVYYLEYDGGSEMFENLVRFFFRFHDPTTPNRQGNDKGTQYFSTIYCYDSTQIRIATKVKEELQRILDANLLPKVYTSKVVCTKIEESTKFYSAHSAHQEYLIKNPKGYCNHKIRFLEWPSLNTEEKIIRSPLLA